MFAVQACGSGPKNQKSLKTFVGGAKLIKIMQKTIKKTFCSLLSPGLELHVGGETGWQLPCTVWCCGLCSRPRLFELRMGVIYDDLCLTLHKMYPNKFNQHWTIGRPEVQRWILPWPFGDVSRSGSSSTEAGSCRDWARPILRWRKLEVDGSCCVNRS